MALSSILMREYIPRQSKRRTGMYRLLEAGTAGGNDLVSWISTIGMFAIIFIVFYFFGIRPQKKQEKQVQEMRNSIQVGDEITTIGGIIGKVISIKEDTLMIETGHDRTKIRILKSAVRNIDVRAEDAEP